MPEKFGLLGSPWRRRAGGELALVVAVELDKGAEGAFPSIRLGGFNDDGTPNDQTWTVDDEAELRRDWEPVRRARVAVGNSTITGDKTSDIWSLLEHLEWGDTGYDSDSDALWKRCPACEGVEPDYLGKDAPKDLRRGHNDRCALRVLLSNMSLRRVTELAPGLEALVRRWLEASLPAGFGALDAPCPLCGATKGETCRGMTSGTHSQRRSVLDDMEHEQERQNEAAVSQVERDAEGLLAELDALKTKGGDRG